MCACLVHWIGGLIHKWSGGSSVGAEGSLEYIRHLSPHTPSTLSATTPWRDFFLIFVLDTLNLLREMFVFFLDILSPHWKEGLLPAMKLGQVESAYLFRVDPVQGGCRNDLFIRLDAVCMREWRVF